MVAQQIQHFEQNHHAMLDPFTLIDPQSSIKEVISTAWHARLPCGHVHAGDIICTRQPFGVARVHRFVHMHNVSCHVEVEPFVRNTSDDRCTWRSADAGLSTIIVGNVVCPVMYMNTHPVYKVILPTVV